jgi:hypothetical protein
MTSRLPLGAILAVLLGSTRVHAEPAMTPKAAAQESYSKGVKLANLADFKHDRALFEAAYLQFAQAYSIYPDDKILWNLAFCELETQRYLDSLKHLHLYDQHQHVLAAPNHHDYAQLVRFLHEAANATSHLTITAPAGSEVKVDGLAVGVAPLADVIDVMPGIHTLEAKGAHAGITVTAGESTTVELKEPTTPAAVVAPVPVVPPPPVPGTSSPRSDSTARNVTGIALLGVSAISFAAAAGLGADRGSKASDADGLRASIGGNSSACAGAHPSAACQQLSSLVSTHDSDANAETGLLVAGGLLAVAGAAVFAFWHPSTPKAAVTWWSPSVTRDGASINFGLHY